MIGFDLGLAQAWADALLRTSVQGGVFVLVAWLLLRWLRDVPPAAEVWVWRILLLKMLLGLVAPLSLTVDATSRSMVPGFTSGTSPASTWVMLAIVVLSVVGVLAWIVMLMFDWRTARRIQGETSACVRPEINAELVRLAGRLNLSGVPELRESALVERPMLVSGGIPFTSYRIVVPSRLLDEEHVTSIGAVLAHELAHLKRRDLPWGWLASLASAVFFFHPAAWLALVRLRSAQDEACDALALRSSLASPGDYGRVLLRIARGPAAPEIAHPMAAGVVESFHGLRSRLLRLARPATPISLASVTLVIVMCVAAAPSWRVVPVPPAVNLGDVLFATSADGEPVTIPVIIGEGIGSEVLLFSTAVPVGPPNLASPLPATDHAARAPQARASETPDEPRHHAVQTTPESSP